MLTTVAKTRKDMIYVKNSPMNKSDCKTPENAFVTQLDATTKSADFTAHTERLLLAKEEMNKKQFSFFLKAHQRHDINLKKNMEFALHCLQKREEIDKMREEEHLQLLKDREKKHLELKKARDEKTKSDIEKARIEQEMLYEMKKKQLLDTELQIREKAKEKIWNAMKQIEHQTVLEKSQKDTVFLAKRD